MALDPTDPSAIPPWEFGQPIPLPPELLPLELGGGGFPGGGGLPGGQLPPPVPPAPPPPPPQKLGQSPPAPLDQEIAGAPIAQEPNSAGLPVPPPVAEEAEEAEIQMPAEDVSGPPVPELGTPPELSTELPSVTERVQDEAEDKRVAAMNPIEYAQYKAGHELEASTKQAADVLAAAGRDNARAIANERAFHDATERASQRQAKLDADAKALADAPLEDKSWLQQLIGAISVGLGAFGAAKTGGPNFALQILEGQTQKTLAQRKLAQADIDRRQGVLGDERRGALDTFVHDEAVRQSIYARAARELELQSMQYDPKGTKRLKMEDTRRQILGEMAKQRSAAQKEMLDQEIKVGEYGLKVDAAQLARQKAAGVGGGAGVGAGKEQLPTADLAAKYGIPADELANLPPTMTDKDFAAVVGKKYDLTKKRQDITSENEERVIGDVSGQPLKQPDGAIWYAPKEEAKGLRKARAGALGLVRTLGQLGEFRGKAGGSNNLTSPGDQRAYKQLANQAVAQYSAATGASISDEQSQNFLRDILLGGDPSAYRVGDLDGRLELARVTLENGYNDLLTGAGFRGKRVEFKNLKANPPATGGSAIDKTIKGEEPVALPGDPNYVPNAPSGSDVPLPDLPPAGG